MKLNWEWGAMGQAGSPGGPRGGTSATCLAWRRGAVRTSASRRGSALRGGTGGTRGVNRNRWGWGAGSEVQFERCTQNPNYMQWEHKEYCSQKRWCSFSQMHVRPNSAFVRLRKLFLKKCNQMNKNRTDHHIISWILGNINTNNNMAVRTVMEWQNSSGCKMWWVRWRRPSFGFWQVVWGINSHMQRGGEAICHTWNEPGWGWGWGRGVGLGHFQRKGGESHD